MQQLLREQASLLKEADRLRTLSQAQQATIAQMQERQTALEQQVVILQTAAGQMDDKGKKQFEKRINQYLKDIDQVIAHLNQ